MANRTLSDSELAGIFAPLLEATRRELERLSAGDADLHWALRRKLYKELSYDERGKPVHRRVVNNHRRRRWLEGSP